MSSFTTGQRVRRPRHVDPSTYRYGTLSHSRWSEVGQEVTWLVLLEPTGRETWWYQSRFEVCPDEYHVDV
jgi:hypothetical protein